MMPMTSIKVIRARLELSQAQLAAALGVSQGNVSFYERGQTVPPAIATRLIAFAGSRGTVLSYDDIYGPQPAESGEKVA